MKNFGIKIKYTLLLLLFILLYWGCSSTYRISDFSSKKNFYKDFNNSVKNKNLEVTLQNDSTFIIYNGAVIENDSLYSLNSFTISGFTKVALIDIRNIKYSGSNYQSAIILLKNGKLYHASKIKFEKNSMQCTYSETVRHNITSISNLKKIVYKNHWLSIPSHLIIGSVAGFLVGFAIGRISDNNTQEGDSRAGKIFVYTWIGGTVAGIIWGWIDGYKYTYKFNP